MRKGRQFIEEAKKIVLDHHDDDEFGINEFCKALCLSRSQVHNIIKSNTGVSTSIFIRNIRLVEASKLLETTEKNISEIAYEVGFKCPNYFSRLFKEVFGESPRDFIIKKIKDEVFLIVDNHVLVPDFFCSN